MAACTRSAMAKGRMRSSVPWMISVGTATRARSSASGVRHPHSSTVAIRTSGVVSSPQAMPSSMGLVECGSGRSSP